MAVGPPATEEMSTILAEPASFSRGYAFCSYNRLNIQLQLYPAEESGLSIVQPQLGIFMKARSCCRFAPYVHAVMSQVYCRILSGT